MLWLQPVVSFNYVDDNFGDIENTPPELFFLGFDAGGNPANGTDPLLSGVIENVNTAVAPIENLGQEAGDFWNVNLSVSVSSPDYWWDVTFWVNNVLDEKDQILARLDLVFAAGNTSDTVNEPRTFGATVSMFF